MPSDTHGISISKEFLEIIQYAQGADLTCEELKVISHGINSSSIKVVFGCIRSLSYGIDCSQHDWEHQSPQLQQVMLQDSKGNTKLISKTIDNNNEKYKAINLDKFEKTFKNATDFNLGVFATIQNDILTSVNIGGFRCDNNILPIALSKDGGKSPL